MQEFNIGDKVVCVCRNYYNWYKIGSEFTIRSGSFVDRTDDGVCYLVEEFSNNKIWIQGNHFELIKEEPKQMKPTDKITVEITLAELAKIYAVMGECSGSTPDTLWDYACDLFDPDQLKRQGFLEDKTDEEILGFGPYESEFLSLIFNNKSKEQIKIEELQSTIDKAARELKELREMGEKK